jgi:hypothetical protein
MGVLIRSYADTTIFSAVLCIQLLLILLSLLFCLIAIGDKFEKLKDRDDQGWCTGRKDGCIGLYPDNYVKLLSE